MDARREVLASVEFELTPEEWMDSTVACVLRGPIYQEQLRRGRRRTALIFGATAVFWLLIGQPGAAMVMIAVGAGLAAAHELLSRRVIRRNAKTGARELARYAFFGPHRVELTAEGVTDITADREAFVRWHAIRGVEESESSFMIRTNPFHYLAIPRTAFGDSTVARRFADVFFEYASKGGNDRSSRIPEPSDPTPLQDSHISTSEARS